MTAAVPGSAAHGHALGEATEERARPSRRRFLGGVAGAAAVASLAGTRPWSRIVAFVDAPVEEALASLLPMSDSVRAVGAAYLAAYPEHEDVPGLVRALRNDLGIDGDGAPGDLRRRALDAVRTDLRTRRTVRLQGWVAAPTEGRLAALALLHHEGRTPAHARG